MTTFGGSIDRSAEDLVVERWSRKTFDAIARQLNVARSRIAIADVDVVIGTGHDWREAVGSVAGRPAIFCCSDQELPDRRLRCFSARRRPRSCGMFRGR
jgi:hypothetical protein